MKNLEVMKFNQPFKLFVPTSIKIHLHEYLERNTPDFKYKIFDFYFIINYFLFKQMYHKEEFFPINYKHLKSIIPINSNNYIKYLKNGEFILRDNYIAGERTYQYKLNPKFELDCNTEPVEPGTRLFEKMQRKYKNRRAHFNRLEPHLKQMKDKLMNLQFDSDAALLFLSSQEDLRKKISYSMQIQNLTDKRTRYFSRNNVNNRLDTNITNLKSDLRNFIVGDFTHIDLKNSQPFFFNQLICSIINRKEKLNTHCLLCCEIGKLDPLKVFGNKAINSILLIHQKRKKSNLVNLKKFKNSVNSGQFYDYILGFFNGKYSRDEVKEIIFKVMFSRNVVYKNYKRFIPFEEEKKVFASVFPFVAEVITILKTRDHKLLPIFLTKMESHIFIDVISKKLVEAEIVPLTIHDSILIETIHAPKAKQIIEDEFMQRFGVIPSLHVKRIIYDENETIRSREAQQAYTVN